MVMAASAMTAAPAAEFLAQARTIAQAAKRVLVVPRGGPAAPSLRVPVPLVADRQAATPVLRAMAHGMIDAYLPAPGAGRDGGLPPGHRELLEEWAHEATPALPAVQIIGQRQSARAHELRGWPATASPTSSTPPIPEKAGNTCSRPRRTAQYSRFW